MRKYDWFLPEDNEILYQQRAMVGLTFAVPAPDYLQRKSVEPFIYYAPHHPTYHTSNAVIVPVNAAAIKAMQRISGATYHDVYMYLLEMHRNPSLISFSRLVSSNQIEQLKQKIEELYQNRPEDFEKPL